MIAARLDLGRPVWLNCSGSKGEKRDCGLVNEISRKMVATRGQHILHARWTMGTQGCMTKLIRKGKGKGCPELGFLRAGFFF